VYVMGTIVGYIQRPDHWVLRVEPRQKGLDTDLFEVLCPNRDQDNLPYTPVIGEYVTCWVGHILIDSEFNEVEPTPVEINGKSHVLTRRTLKAYSSPNL